MSALPSMLALSVALCVGNPCLSAVPGPRGHVKHVVVLFQENRTPDNLFHGLPGADIADSGVDSKGNVIPLAPVPLVIDYDLEHRHADFVAMYHDGAMDGADRIPTRCRSDFPQTACHPPDAPFKYVDPADVAPYFELAQGYTFGDRMFQSNQGPSFPAHQYIISGTSTPTAGGDYDRLLAAENPFPLNPTGCIESPPGERVALIDPRGRERLSIFPCFEHPVLMDLLKQAGHTWTYYTLRTGSIWTGPNAIRHLTQGDDWTHVVVPSSQILDDIAAGRLADVAWVIPPAGASDHALNDKSGDGPSWVASVVNAIGASAYWSDTAIFVTWDDWGGWYDHVPPTIHSSYESGFRVPLIVVSPYAKKGHVSHVTHTFGSILKFVEVAFDLPSLGYEDARSDDLADCFDFNQAVTPHRRVPSPHDAAYFLRQADATLSEDDDY